MKRILALIPVAATFFSACSGNAFLDGDADLQRLSVILSVTDASKADTPSGYPDGHGDFVDNWVVEVRDTLLPGVVFYHGVKAGEKGVHQQTFDLHLVKGHTYDIAFWADKAGCWDATSLAEIKCTDITKIGNNDEYDGFYTCVRHTVVGNDELSAQLYRPFAQVNVITTDLPDLKSTSTPEAYLAYKPVGFKFSLTAPTTFDVFSGKTSGEDELVIVPEASRDTCYTCYGAAAPKTTLHMVYVLANQYSDPTKHDIRNIDFSFATGEVDHLYEFSNVPLKRNWRTNIIGSFMTNALKWDIEIIPDWDGEKEYNYPEDSE